VEQFYDPVKGIFLADRYIKGECPNCGAKDQYGDACENCGTVYTATELKNPYSTLSGAAPVLRARSTISSGSPIRNAALSSSNGSRRPPSAAQVVNKPRSGSKARRQALADWDISRDPPYFGIRIPDIKEEKYLYVWLDAPVGYLRPSRTIARRKAGFREAAAGPEDRADPFHRQGHHLFPHLVLAGDAEYAGKPYKVPDHVYVHGFITVSGDKMSSRAAPASARCATSKSA